MAMVPHNTSCILLVFDIGATHFSQEIRDDKIQSQGQLQVLTDLFCLKSRLRSTTGV